MNVTSQLMPQQLLTSILELVVNKALTLNIQGKGALKPLEQKTLTVILAELGFPLSFSVDQNIVLVTTLTERSNCTIHTSLSTLKKLKDNQQITTLIKQEALVLEGDIKIAQQFASIAESLNIDWQSELAKNIGDIPTYKLSQFSQFISSKFNFAKQQIEADASEWLVHEKRLVVTASQVNQFNQDVSNLTSKIDVISQRMKQLTETLNSLPLSKDNCE
jgi:ubiquinone biosynthesis protein UbiJ